MTQNQLHQVAFREALQMARNICIESPKTSEAAALRSAAHWSGIDSRGLLPTFLAYVAAHRSDIANS